MNFASFVHSIRVQRNYCPSTSRYPVRLGFPALIISAILLLAGCGGGGGDDLGTDAAGSAYTIGGKVQKGPFQIGSTVTIQELNESLEPTGVQFNTTTVNDLGHFNTTVEISSPFVEVITDGFFFDEVRNQFAMAPMTLRTISEYLEGEAININLLTQLARTRVKYLVLTGSGFSDAQAQAQSEILTIFHIENTEVGAFDSLDITTADDSGAILLAISAILMQTAIEQAGDGSPVAELSNLMASLGLDIEQDGTLDDATLKENIRQAAINVDLAAVRDNLFSHYAGEGEAYNPPSFENFVDTDGDGIIPLEDDNDPEAFTLTPVGEVDPGAVVDSNEITVTGILGVAPVSLAGGVLLRDSGDGGGYVEVSVTTPVDAATGTVEITEAYVSEGDKLKVQLTASGEFDETVSATLAIGQTSSNFSISTFAITSYSFSLAGETYAEIGTDYTSGEISVNGLTVSYLPVTLSNGMLLKNGAAVAENTTTVTNGNTLAVRLTSSSIFSSSVSASINIGLSTENYTIVTRPGEVTGFTAEGTGTTGEIALSWTNPGYVDYRGVRIMRREGGTFPTGPIDPAATLVYEGLDSTFTDSGLTDNTTYSFTAFAYDEASRFAPGSESAATLWFWTTISAIGGDEPYTLALKSDSTLWAWGNNDHGQLGLGSNQNIPTQVGTNTNWTAIAAGGDIYTHTMAMKLDGSIWAWGYNGKGQLGLGDTSDRNTPIQVGTDSDWTAIDAGGWHTLGLRSDGTLWAWGWNLKGQLGNSTNNDSSNPVQIGTDTDWITIATGGSHSLAVRTNGTLWTWGQNNEGQLGDGTTTDRNSPVQVGSDTDWTAITAGIEHTIALKLNGTLWAWGNGNSSPVQFGTDTDWTAIAAGSSSLAQKSGGTIWNLEGGISNPVQVGADADWAAIATGGSHSLAIKTNGSLWAWGWNYFGQLGLGDTTDRDTPTQVVP